MIHLVSFTDHRMTLSACKMNESALRNGVDVTRVYTPADFPEYFKQMAAPCLKEQKGAGLYIWKPWLVFDYIQSQPDGEIVIYADAGQTFINNVKTVVAEMKEDIMFFSNGHVHLEWCKGDVMAAINGHDPEYFDSGFTGISTKDKQVQASLIFFRLTPQVRDLIKEWMLWALMPGFCDDSPSRIPNYPTFADTRHDQAIICCLQIKYGYKLHWFPTTTAYHIKAEYPGDGYPAIVDHHRKRNPGMSAGDSEW